MNWPKDNLEMSEREGEYGMIMMNECVISSDEIDQNIRILVLI